MKRWFAQDNQVVISPFSLLMPLVVVLFLGFLYLINSVLVRLFIAFVLMVAMKPLITNLRKYLKLPKTASVLVAYTLFLVLILGIFGLLIPPLFYEAQQLSKVLELPFFLKDVDVAAYFNGFNFALQDIPAILERAGDSINLVFGVVNSTISFIFTLITIMVMSIFMFFEHDTLYYKVRWFTSRQDHLVKSKLFFEDVEKQLGGWVRGQTILMVVVGLLNYAALLFLGIPYALPLALVAALLEIVPNLGPTIAAVIACAVAFLTKGFAFSVATLVIAIVIQQLENNILVPKIMQVNANVNPLISLVAILIGFTLAGVVGGFLAIPMYIIFRAIYSTFVRPA